MRQKIREHFQDHIKVMEQVSDSLTDELANCAASLVSALRGGNKVLVMGNGGSAADAQHFAAELVGRFLLERKALPAVALTTDSSILTAVGNDYGFNEVFKRQVEALAVPGDVVIGISTSGNSENVLRALRAAADIGCPTVGLLGRDGGAIGPLADHSLIVPSQHTPYIQEAHVTIIHLLCDLIEQELFG